jgi:hypothetical protein
VLRNRNLHRRTIDLRLARPAMPQSLDVAPSSSSPTEEGIYVPDPPPPKVAEHLTGRLSSCQLSALCLLNKQYCHAGCDFTHASLSIQRTFESPTSDQDALFSALYGPNTPFRSNCAQFEEEEVSDPEPAARGPGAGQPVHICVHTQQQDVSLITQAPRRGGKRKGMPGRNSPTYAGLRHTFFWLPLLVW